jgi:hypothetical protein
MMKTAAPSALEELRTVVTAGARPRASGSERPSETVEFRCRETGVFHVTLSDLGGAVARGPHPRPDVRVFAAESDLLKVFSGAVSISQNIANGEITFAGHYLTLIRLEKLIIASMRRRG